MYGFWYRYYGEGGGGSNPNNAVNFGSWLMLTLYDGRLLFLRNGFLQLGIKDGQKKVKWD